MLHEMDKALQAAGYRMRAVSVHRIPELKAEFDVMREEGVLSEEMHQICTKRLPAPADLPRDMEYILIVAAPSPAIRMTFLQNGVTVDTQAPPTYQDYAHRPPEIEAMLLGVATESGRRVVWQRGLPNKLLAVRSGLAEYGRNNIAYVEGMGSAVFLSAYLTDMPCEDTWGQAHRMAFCDSCTRCVESCPTGAIHADRRVIDAARCLTMLNESDASVPFPEWVPIQAHNSVVGCMHCQAICPRNKGYYKSDREALAFDEQETVLILSGRAMDEMPAPLREKMESVHMSNYQEALARNLKVLFEKATQ